MTATTIVNPILRGFNPDPSICRVGDDFYIATSTFEWYPGVQIHHSRDLCNWQLITRPLDEARLLNMLGEPDSCGVWAPCLTWSDDKFWLAYTDVKRFDGNFKDTHNYLTTASSIDGPWSDPIYLNSSGFDPSLYHAEDGRVRYVNMVWDHRPGRTFFKGIDLQEFDTTARRLVGQPRHIFSGTELDYTEAPHIFKHAEYYYLLTAEGGTGYGHAMTIARAREITGPYETDPAGPLVTTRNDPHWPLQRTGHGNIVQLADGSFYVVFLCSRIFGENRDSPLGRETAIHPVVLKDDGWFRLASDDGLPRLEVEGPDLSESIVDPEIELDDFDSDQLNIVYQWLRTPWPEEFYSLSERPGFLRLYGMESPGSLYKQSLIGRRQKHFSFTAETRLEFEPDNFQQMAGLALYYNASKFHYLYVSTDDETGKHLGIMSCEADLSLQTTFPLHEARVKVPEQVPIELRMRVEVESLRFSWRAADSEEGDWNDIPLRLDVGLLTDQAGMDGREQFTGTFIAACAHDVSGGRIPADFDYLHYMPD